MMLLLARSLAVFGGLLGLLSGLMIVAFGSGSAASGIGDQVPVILVGIVVALCGIAGTFSAPFSTENPRAAASIQAGSAVLGLLMTFTFFFVPAIALLVASALTYRTREEVPIR
jgi:hypothetical protein